MNHIRIASAATLLALSMGAVMAQGGSMGPGAGAGPGASAPGMGMGMGPGAARGGPRWNADDTAGWAMMSPQEREEHRTTMRAMKTYEECTAYKEKHHAQMAERAKARGGKPLAQPRRDACAWLKR